MKLKWGRGSNASEGESIQKPVGTTSWVPTFIKPLEHECVAQNKGLLVLSSGRNVSGLKTCIIWAAVLQIPCGAEHVPSSQAIKSSGSLLLSFQCRMAGCKPWRLLMLKHLCEQHGSPASFIPKMQCWRGPCITCVGAGSSPAVILKSSFPAAVMVVTAISSSRGETVWSCCTRRNAFAPGYLPACNPCSQTAAAPWAVALRGKCPVLPQPSGGGNGTLAVGFLQGCRFLLECCSCLHKRDKIQHWWRGRCCGKERSRGAEAAPLAYDQKLFQVKMRELGHLEEEWQSALRGDRLSVGIGSSGKGLVLRSWT